MFKENFWKINYNELILDGILIIASVIFSKFVFRESEFFSHSSPIVFFGIYTCVAMILPWYMGVLFARYLNTYHPVISIFMFISILLALFFMIIFLFFFGWKAMKDLPVAEYYPPTVLVLSLFSGWSFYVGYRIANGLIYNPAYKVQDDNKAGNFFYYASTLSAFGVAGAYFGDIGGWMFLLFAVLMFAGLAFTHLVLGVFDMIIKKVDYIIPVMLILALIFWNEMGGHYLRQALDVPGEEAPFGLKFFMLTIMGFIPFRLVLIFAPPVRAINLAIGIAAAAYYIFSF